jgi:hypothetical protein
VCASNPETWLSLRDKTRNDIVEFVVRADPEPIRGVTTHTRQGAILQPDTDSPETGCELFPVQGWMRRIFLPELISLPRNIAHTLREHLISSPEIRGR